MCRLKNVEKRIENVKIDEDPSGWRPYNDFVNTLHDKYSKNEGVQGIVILPLGSFLCFGSMPS